TAVGVLVAIAPWLLVWTTLWAVAGWWIGGGFAGFIGWGLLPPIALATGQQSAVVFAAMALTTVVMVRRMQGNVGDPTDLRSRLQRAVWDTDRTRVVAASDAEERSASCAPRLVAAWGSPWPVWRWPPMPSPSPSSSTHRRSSSAGDCSPC